MVNERKDREWGCRGGIPFRTPFFKNNKSHRPVRTGGSFGKNTPPIFVDGTPASAEAPAVVGLPPPDGLLSSRVDGAWATLVNRLSLTTLRLVLLEE